MNLALSDRILLRVAIRPIIVLRAVGDIGGLVMLPNGADLGWDLLTKSPAGWCKRALCMLGLPPRPWSGVSRLAVVLLAVVSVIAGCDSPVSSLPARELPAFVAVGEPATCPDRCVPAAVYVARAELGLDPTILGADIGGGPKALLRALAIQGGEAGGIISSISIVSLMSGLNEESMFPVVLVHKSGHLYLMLGVVNVRGQLLCQLVHGDAPVLLVAKDELLRAGFQEAWRIAGNERGVPVCVGQGLLRVDKVFYNFGEVRPGENLKCTFLLRNVGASPVVLGAPRTSCSCTATSLVESSKLNPGESKEIDVAVEAVASTSLKQSVHLPIYELASAASIELDLLLLGCQRQLMTVTPMVLDFGVVAPGKSYSRSVQLNEAATDRGVLRGVDVRGLPLTYRVSQATSSYGLMASRIDFVFRAPEDYAPGPQQHVIHVLTGSTFRPTIPVEVKFDIPPPVHAVPGVISVGTLVVGESREVKVRFVSRGTESIDVCIESYPDECSIVLDESKGPPEMTVTVRISEAGIWSGVVRATVHSGLHSHPLDIRCVGFARN